MNEKEHVIVSEQVWNLVPGDVTHTGKSFVLISSSSSSAETELYII